VLFRSSPSPIPRTGGLAAEVGVGEGRCHEGNKLRLFQHSRSDALTDYWPVAALVAAPGQDVLETTSCQHGR